MSYTIRLKTSAIQMGKTSTVNQNTNPTANNSSDFNLNNQIKNNQNVSTPSYFYCYLILKIIYLKFYKSKLY